MASNVIGDTLVRVPSDADPGLTSVGEERVIAPPILVEYWRAVVRWKWLILAILLLTLAGGLVATLLTPPKYTASSRLEISREARNVTNVEGVESANTGRELEFYQTQYTLLQSRTLAERVARVLRLSANEEFLGDAGAADADGTSVAPRQAGTERRLLEERVVNKLLADVEIAPVRGSALTDIRYTHGSPEIAARIANAWAQQFIESSVDRRFAATRDAAGTLERRLEELRARLERAERDLANYSASKDIVPVERTVDADGRTQTERTLTAVNLSALNEALATATAERIAAQARQQARGARGGDASSNPALAQLRVRRAEVAAEYARMLTQFEPGYEPARALNNQLRTLDQAIAAEESRVSGGQSADYRAAAQREQALRQRVDALKAGLQNEQRDRIQYNIFQREVDTTRQLYDSLLQRYKEIGVAGVDASNIMVVDTAVPPKNPSTPNLPLNLAIAALIGLGLAALAVIALEQIDERIRDPMKVADSLSVPLLGSVPFGEDGAGIDAVRDPKTEMSEAYLSVRTRLAFSTDHGLPRAVLVTSTQPAEGKTTTSVALALVLARTGRRVLLVDGDMRSPSIASAFGLAERGGLSNLLAGDDNWQALVHRVESDNVSVLTSGPVPPSAAELLSSERYPALVAALRGQYDNIIIDGPPILGLADAPLLAKGAEGVIFVASAQGVAMRIMRNALNRLFAVNAVVFGVVVTKLRQREAGYGYGYGYGGYRYGADNDPALNS